MILHAGVGQSNNPVQEAMLMRSPSGALELGKI